MVILHLMRTQKRFQVSRLMDSEKGWSSPWLKHTTEHDSQIKAYLGEYDNDLTEASEILQNNTLDKYIDESLTHEQRAALVNDFALISPANSGFI
jgi:hypothetical protein